MGRHMCASIYMNTVVKVYGLDAVPNTNHMGRQVGTSINMNTVVKFMG
jgi:hypothetical protein